MVMKPQFGLLFCPKYLMISHFLSKRPTFFSSFHKHLKDKIFKDNGAFLMAQLVKNCLTVQKMLENRVWSLGRKDLLEKEMQPAPLFLPGKLHGQRNMTGYSPWGWTQSTSTRTKIMTSHFQPFCPLSAMAAIWKADIQVIFLNLME